ncbi:F-box protein At2g02240-like [Triticum dicoccoides]|uniref:F-box protein At2g02240-like n=1 Tax=Triticum dicoccoides TaxID=85692 RepID=UPI001890E850|nr:F-box protein At2g02240-like [Triticum dicoccoides]
MESCEIARLPEELVSAALSLTSPRDACRAAAVSPAFRAAADSDAVWACFLPPLADQPPLADGEALLACGKKDLFLRLSGSSVLLPGGLMSMWLDRETAAKCYMVAARELSIAWRDTPQHWTWIPLEDSRFSDSAELIWVCWLEIRGKIHSKMLSQGSTYAVYTVYKLAEEPDGLNFPVNASVSVGGSILASKVCLQRDPHMIHPEDVALPHQRVDGWMELELGEFICEAGEDGDVSFGLSETESLYCKSGLILQGIEIRCKN